MTVRYGDTFGNPRRDSVTVTADYCTDPIEESDRPDLTNPAKRALTVQAPLGQLEVLIEDQMQLRF